MPISNHKIILGIDPGSTRVGYGIIEINGNKSNHLGSGLLKITTPSLGFLREIEEELEKIIKEFNPSCLGIEKLFFVKNQKTGIRVAEARGVIISTALRFGLEIKEFAPSEIKLAIAGSGNASKAGVAKMVRYFIKLPDKKIIDDTTDALAIALAAGYSRWD